MAKSSHKYDETMGEYNNGTMDWKVALVPERNLMYTMGVARNEDEYEIMIAEPNVSKNYKDCGYGMLLNHIGACIRDAIDKGVVKNDDWLISNLLEDGHLIRLTLLQFGRYHKYWVVSIDYTNGTTNYYTDVKKVFRREDSHIRQVQLHNSDRLQKRRVHSRIVHGNRFNKSY